MLSLLKALDAEEKYSSNVDEKVESESKKFMLVSPGPGFVDVSLKRARDLKIEQSSANECP